MSYYHICLVIRIKYWIRLSLDGYHVPRHNDPDDGHRVTSRVLAQLLGCLCQVELPNSYCIFLQGPSLELILISYTDCRKLVFIISKNVILGFDLFGKKRAKTPLSMLGRHIFLNIHHVFLLLLFCMLFVMILFEFLVTLVFDKGFICASLKLCENPTKVRF